MFGSPAPRRRIALLAVALIASAAPGDAPKKKPAYPFALAPEKAVAALSRLEKVSGHKRPLSADEKALAADVKGGRFTKWSPAEAALLADGVTDRAERKKLLQRYEEVRDEAKKAVAGLKTSAEKGKKLLEVLHAGAMKKGYLSGQSTLSGVLRDGTFNCVSATVLYNAVACDLGLEVDAVEEPGGFLAGHVYSRLRSQGKWVVVETTSARGFAAQRAFGDSSRALTPPGLAAVIWSNRAADATGAKRFHEAAVHALLALSIAPAGSAANGRAALVKWGLELSEKHRYADSQAVHEVALEIDPKNPDLLNNRHVVFLRWAEHLAKGDRIDDGLAVLRRAMKQDPTHAGAYEREQARLFTARGEELIEKGKWQEAHDLVAPGHKKLAGRPLQELASWQEKVYLRWGNKHLDAREFEKAVGAYEKGMKAYPKFGSLDNNRWYAVREWLAHARKHEGEKKALELARKLNKRYQGKQQIADILYWHVSAVLDAHLEGGKYAAARASLKAHADLLGKDAARRQAHRLVARHADALADKGDWAAAHRAYADARKEAPGDKELAEWGAALWDRQARELMDRKRWKEAIEVYEEGLKSYPDSSLLANNRDYCKQEMMGGNG